MILTKWGTVTVTHDGDSTIKFAMSDFEFNGQGHGTQDDAVVLALEMIIEGARREIAKHRTIGAEGK